MRPAFETVTIIGEQVKVVGPIDLFGNEWAYFWVRVTQGRVLAPAAEAIGISEMDNDAVKAAVGAVDMALRDVVGAIHAPSTGPTAASRRNIPRKIREVTAMWEATVPIEHGKFDKSKPVRVEAWALVRTTRPTRMFNVYWEENGVKLT